MPLYVATAFFEMNGAGWTESYYRDSAGQMDLAAIADFDRAGIWTLRQGMLAQPARITAQRASFVTIQGDSVLNYIPMNAGQAWESEDANTAMLVRLGNADNTRRKNVFVRGIPDDMVLRGGTVGNAAGWKNAADAFFFKLIERQYGWYSITGRTDHPVTGYVLDAQNRVKVTLDPAPALGLAVGDKVVLQGVNVGVSQPSVLNGNHPFIVTGAAEVTTAKRLAVFPFPGLGGKLRKVTKDLQVAFNHRYQKIDTRKAGKASHLQAGRARAKAKG